MSVDIFPQTWSQVSDIRHKGDHSEAVRHDALRRRQRLQKQPHRICDDVPSPGGQTRKVLGAVAWQRGLIGDCSV